MGKPAGTEITNYEYQQTVALVVSTEAKRLRRIWFDNDVVYDDRPEISGWSGRPMTSDGRRPSLASYLKSENIEVHLGAQTQGTSPTLEALVGTADLPAYRGRLLVVFKDLPIHKFGGRLPGMSFEVEGLGTDGAGKADLADVVNTIIDMAGSPDNGVPGVPAANRDLSALVGIEVDGFVLSTRTEARQHLAPLQDAYMFDMVDVDYKLTAVLRGGDPVGTVDISHLGMGTPDPQPNPYEIVRGQQMEVPGRMVVSYHSAAIDFQNFTQNTARESTSVRKSEQLALPVVMSEADAMAVARKKLAMLMLQRDTWKVCLPMRYLAWAPTDVFLVPLANGLTQRLKITKQLIGLFGHIELTCVPDDPDIYTLTGEGAAPPSGGGGSVLEAFPPVLYAADLPALVNTPDASFDGCNLVTVVASARTGWAGANVQSQATIKDVNGNNQTLITQNTTKGTMGTLQATLAKWEGANVWDDVSTITVKLVSVFSASAEAVGTNVGNGIIEMQDPSTSGGAFAGTYLVEFSNATNFTVEDPLGNVIGAGSVGNVFSTEVVFKITAGSTAFANGDRFNILVSPVGAAAGTPPAGATDLEVLNGANVLVVEGEIIQYASALDLGSDTYELTRLLRGRRGTEHLARNDKTTGATVAFLGTHTAKRFKAHLSEVGNTRTLNAFDIGKSDASYTNTPSTTVTMAGNVRKPWGPGAARADASGSDWVLQWVYRSRWGDELANGGTGTVALGETSEEYEVEIWDSTFTTLKRTVTGLASPTWTYTAAMQVTDWGAAPQATYGVKLYQKSPLVGRGFPSYLVVA